MAFTSCKCMMVLLVSNSQFRSNTLPLLSEQSLTSMTMLPLPKSQRACGRKCKKSELIEGKS